MTATNNNTTNEKEKNYIWTAITNTKIQQLKLQELACVYDLDISGLTESVMVNSTILKKEIQKAKLI